MRGPVMGLVLGMPLSTFFIKITTEPLVVLKTVFLYYWLKYLGRSRRLDLYEALSSDLTKNDAIIPPFEYQLEKPSQILSKNTSDVILVYSGNVSGDRLVARVCREEEGHVAWLYVRLSDGRSYELPQPEKISPPSEDFMAGGLKIKCLLPMRKWRLSFNGLLREFEEGTNESRIAHVKFSFLCKCSSFPFDLSTDIHPAVLADYLAKESSTTSLVRPMSVTQYLDSYVQASNLFGTISVDGSEELELYLWGARKRSKEIPKPKGSTCVKEFIGYTKDGQLIYSGELLLPGFKNILPFAFYLERTTISWPVTKCEHSLKRKQNSFGGMKIVIETDRSALTASVAPHSKELKWTAFGLDTNCYLTKFSLHDGDIGHGIYLENIWSHRPVNPLMKPMWRFPIVEGVAKGSKPPTILTLGDPYCRDSGLSGGKGSSLAALTYLASNNKTNFKVPSGFVLTTNAYKEFLSKSGEKSVIDKLQDNIWRYNTDQIKEACNKIVEKLSHAELPDGLKKNLQMQLCKQFPDKEKKGRFAVRSSACGEDSEEMSAAGQMSTLLGVEGLENICKAASACWASQFSFTAIQYKRQNGQELNLPMAVVVQEMVPADTAGVLFTCDPVTGNPQNITITANYGLGESVVSASAEPDTIVMERNENNQVHLQKVLIGKKKTKIVMGEHGNVLEESVEVDDTGNCSLSEKYAQILTEAGLKIEEAYGFPVDLEWAYKDTELYMLQARPITTFDKETKFELSHALSTAMRAENEYFTKANVGEVMPGSFSNFGLSFTLTYMPICLEYLYGHRNKHFLTFNPFYAKFPVFYGQMFISMLHFILRFYKKGAPSFLADAGCYAGFGRKLDDEALYDLADRRNRMYPPTFIPYQMIFFIKDMVLGERYLNTTIKNMWDYEVDLSKCSNSKEIFYKTNNACVSTTNATACHFVTSTNSSILNNLVLGLLATENKGWDVNVLSDFALILSSCGKLESADIPRMTLWVASEIKKSISVEKFKAMTPEEACEWLETTTTSAGPAFKEFIRRHGHRCIKEFDVYSVPWRINKLPFVKTLQETITQKTEDDKPFVSTEEVIKKLKVKVSWKSKLLLKVLIPLARRGVFNRERSKSIAIKLYDSTMRKCSWILAEQLVKEGRLPEKELMFSLSTHEVMELIETRSPSMVQRAIRRNQIFKDLDNLRFPEISSGIPKALNIQKRDLGADQNSDLEITGTPVSQGVISAYARVAINIEEAAKIEPGEILLAYSTDIAWSPYFPLLAGVATELGGLISHGAVVAREYGLPCVVGVFDATSKFRTGDYVYLDGNKGILKRIKAPGKT